MNCPKVENAALVRLKSSFELHLPWRGRRKSGYMLEYPGIPQYRKVTICGRRGQSAGKIDYRNQNPQRLHARPADEARRYSPDCMATCRMWQKWHILLRRRVTYSSEI